MFKPVKELGRQLSNRFKVTYVFFQLFDLIFFFFNIFLTLEIVFHLREFLSKFAAFIGNFCFNVIKLSQNSYKCHIIETKAACIFYDLRKVVCFIDNQNVVSEINL